MTWALGILAYLTASAAFLAFTLTLCAAAKRGDQMGDETVSSKLEEALESELFGAAE